MKKLLNIEKNASLEELNAVSKGTLMESLGIVYTVVNEGYVEGEMMVNERTIQPWKILHGGAALALAETLGGLGSQLIIDSEKYVAVGSQVSANHVGMSKGEKVIGEAKIIHKGRRTHVWNIDVKNEDGSLVSTVRLTNQIIEN